jgi:predicted metal-dependent enzyme (double-stranded beta helix superfamily)
MDTARQHATAATAVAPAPGLVDELDAAIRGRTCEELTAALRKTLCRLMREQRLALPAEVFQPNPDHYARREIHRSAELGYTVIAMTWGPGQGTPVHDHSGLWCVEGVVAGSLEIVQYELLERDGDTFRFEQRGTLDAGAGSAGSLIPPHEYHSIRNPSADHVAVSLHVYGGEMTCCSTFQPLGQDRYACCAKPLGLD